MGRQPKPKRTKSAKARQRLRERREMRAISDGYPFLNNESTLSFIKDTKVMFIMRGLPGSGKTTIVGLLTAKYRRSVVCSADEFFLDDDRKYVFDRSKLPQAHEYCQEKARVSCEEGKNVVIIDNTNVQRWEMVYYFKLAARTNYGVIIVLPQTAWMFDPAELARKNKHGVPESIIKEKVKSFHPVYPLYYGWFLNDDDSYKLLDLGSKYFSLCVQHIDRFHKHMKEQFTEEDVTVSFTNLYSRSTSRTRRLHCTARFCSRDNKDETEEYASQQVVRKSLGKIFNLCVIGIVVTPRTVGARVALSEHQLALWANEQTDKLTDSNSQDCSPDGSAACGEVDVLEDTRENRDFEAYSQREYLTSRPRFAPTKGHGSRAHFTLGWSKDVTAVQTGLDLINVIQLEEKEVTRPRCVSIDGTALRYYGDGHCVVYFDEPVYVKTMFSGQY